MKLIKLDRNNKNGINSGLRSATGFVLIFENFFTNNDFHIVQAFDDY